MIFEKKATKFRRLSIFPLRFVRQSIILTFVLAWYIRCIRIILRTFFHHLYATADAEPEVILLKDLGSVNKLNILIIKEVLFN